MLPPGSAGPLDGIRVLDLTQALAGPYCTMLLADLGADVVKIEPPNGDMTRFSGPFLPDDPEQAYGGYFASVNRGKRSVVLDLKQDDDRERFLRLVDDADAVVENSRAGVMDRLGVGFDVLHARNPRLVYAAIRGFGDPRTGESPYVDWPAYDIVAQAMGGLVSVTGAGPGEIAKCGPSVGDIFTGALNTVGVLAALLHAVRTGEGQFVDVAMYDAVLSLCEGAAYQHQYLGHVPGPTGNGHPVISPMNIYPTADGHCGIGAPNDRTFAALCSLIGRDDLATDERFAGPIDRLLHRGDLDRELVEWTSARTTAQVVEILGGRVPVGPVNDMAMIAADPHTAARQMLVDVEHPSGDAIATLAGQPIKMTATPTGVRRRPPRLGEHQREIFGDDA